MPSNAHGQGGNLDHNAVLDGAAEPSTLLGAPPLYSQHTPSSLQRQLRPPSFGPSSSSSIFPRAAACHDDAFQFDIVPRADAASFQVGYHGLQQRGFDAWIRGDVLVKWARLEDPSSEGINTGTSTLFSQCTIDLLATESVNTTSHPMVEQLHHTSVTLWRSPSLPGSSATASTHSPHLPSVMPFELSLPEHLQHCIHLPKVKLEYSLIATLHPHPDQADREPVTKSVLVHLTRYTPPNPMRELLPASLAQRFSEEPKLWTITYPTRIEARLSRTLFRRAERIDITVKVPPPDEKLVDKGLRIRSVEAELIRLISTSDQSKLPSQQYPCPGPVGAGSPPRPTPGKSTDKGKAHIRDLDADSSATHSRSTSRAESVATSDGWEPHAHLLSDEDGCPPSHQGTVGTSAVGQSPTATQPVPSPSELPPPPFEDDEQQPRAPNLGDDEQTLVATQHSSTVLAHSGKSCRFSMQRPLRLNLTLVPPFSAPTLPHPTPDHDAPPAGLSPLSVGTTGGGGGCESVSQETHLSRVDFSVRIRIRMSQPDGQETESGGHGTRTVDSAFLVSRSSSQNRSDILLEQDIFILPGVAGRPARIPGSGDAGFSDSLSDLAVQADGGEHTEQAELPAEEEFDGYEDFRGQRHAYEDAIDDVPRLGFSAPPLDGVSPTLPPSFEATTSSRAIDGGAVVSAVARHQDESEEPPPNLEQSRHDLQIFPAHDDHNEFPPPPPHHTEDLEADMGLPATHADSPPSWAAYEVQEGLPGRLPHVHIEGVGVGEPRLHPPDGPSGAALSAEDTDPASRVPGAWPGSPSVSYLPLEDRTTRSPPPTFDFVEGANAAGGVRQSLEFGPPSSPALDVFPGPPVHDSPPPPPSRPRSDASDLSDVSGDSDEVEGIAGEPPPYIHPPLSAAAAAAANTGIPPHHRRSSSSMPVDTGEGGDDEAASVPEYDDEPGQAASSSSARPFASTSTGRGEAGTFRTAAEEKAALAAAYSSSIEPSAGDHAGPAQADFPGERVSGSLAPTGPEATNATSMSTRDGAGAAQDVGGSTHNDQGMPPAYAASSSPPSRGTSPAIGSSLAFHAPEPSAFDEAATAAHLERAVVVQDDHLGSVGPTHHEGQVPIPGHDAITRRSDSQGSESAIGDRDGLPDYEA